LALKALGFEIPEVGEEHSWSLLRKPSPDILLLFQGLLLGSWQIPDVHGARLLGSLLPSLIYCITSEPTDLKSFSTRSSKKPLPTNLSPKAPENLGQKI